MARCSKCGLDGHKAPTCGRPKDAVKSPSASLSSLRSLLVAPAPSVPVVIPQNILSHKYTKLQAYSTGVGVLDKMFVSRMEDSIGFPRGGIFVLTGRPGLGKTTLVTQVLDGLASEGCDCTLATNEMDTNSLSGLAKALNLKHGFRVFDKQTETETIIANMVGIIRAFPNKQVVLAIDSLQGLNLGQKNPTAKAWIDIEAFAKETGTIVIIINHLRKDGDMAGAAIVNQRCECVMEVTRDEESQTLSLQLSKNRFGSVGEIIGMTMGKDGISFKDAVIV